MQNEKEYNFNEDFFAQLRKLFNENKIDFLSPPLSRDKYNSLIISLITRIKNKKVKKVHTFNLFIIFITSIPKYLWRILLVYSRIIKPIIIVQKLKKQKKIKYEINEIILFDLNPLENSLIIKNTTSEYNDLYYDKNIKEYIKKNHNAYYVANFVGGWNFNDKVFISLYNNSFFLKEYFLSISDVITVLISHSLSLIKLLMISKKRFPLINNLSSKNVILYSFIDKLYGEFFLKGMINYKFLKNLKGQQYNIIRLIDWFENHAIDQGLCLGMNDFFDKKRYIPFQNFAQDYNNFNFHLPLKCEINYGVCKNQLVLISNIQKENLKKNNPYINVITVSSERFNIKNRIFDKINYENKIKNIIIFLPFENKTTFELLKSLEYIVKYNNKINIYIKIHKNNKNNKQITKKIDYFRKYLAEPSFSFLKFNPSNTIILSALSTIQIDLLFSGFRLFNMNIDHLNKFKPYNINVLQIKNINSSKFFKDENFLNKINEYFPISKPDFFNTDEFKNEIKENKNNINLLNLIKNYETIS